MAPTFVLVVLALLTASVALNLLLTLRLAAIVAARERERLPATLPPGTPLPAFSARPLSGGAAVASGSLRGTPAVLVFLSPGCAACSARREELVRLHPAMRRAGVGLWVFVNARPARARDYLRETPLLQHALRIDEAVAQRLNPRNAAPFYLFVDADGAVIASDFIGDADWASFRAQMEARPDETADEAAAAGARSPDADPV